MWLAYHISVSVPARSRVSWKEKPTPASASTKRRLRQVSWSTSLAVPSSSSMWMTFMEFLSSFGWMPGGASRRSGAHGLVEQRDAALQLLIGDRQRRHELDDFVVRAGGLD